MEGLRMKISKVNHVKAGVAETPIEAGGMLYSHPSNDREVSDLRAHVDRRCDSAQKLYSVLTNIENKPKYKVYGDIVGKYFKIIVNYIHLENSNEEIYNKLVEGNDFIKIRYKKNEYKGKVCEIGKQCGKGAQYSGVIVDLSLRQSLRKNVKGTSIYIPDVVKTMGAALLSDDYMDNFKQISKDEVISIIEAVRKDYKKEEQKEGIIKSINNQNVQVQVDMNGEKLILASAYNVKKKYIFDFLVKYSEANKATQKEILKHMRYLILLYYYGEKIANDANECDLSDWTFGTSLAEFDNDVSAEILDLVLTKKEIPAKNKADLRANKDALNRSIDNMLVNRYQTAVNVAGLSENDKKWINYISDHASKLLDPNKIDDKKIRLSYLCTKTWDEWLSFIAGKFIEMGKGVYNFALDNVDKVKSGKSVSLGIISEKYRGGISSFDYERIKAEDMLNREMSGYVAFAVNGFDSSVRSNDEKQTEKREDILTLKPNEITLLPNAKKRVLRFFGGVSSFEGTEMDNVADMDLVLSLREEIYAARNSSFHFITETVDVKDKKIVEMLFDKEFNSLGGIYRKKYYSNNVPRFYEVSDIDRLMDQLYSKRKINVDQIPSYNKVLSRNELATVLHTYLNSENYNQITKPSIAEIYRSSLYYVLKEIYYCDFVARDDLMDRFTKGLSKVQEKKLLELKDNNRKKSECEKAYEDFKSRFDTLKQAGMDFGSICQEIMTEYNQQNSQKSKKASAYKTVDRDGNDKVNKVENTEIYKHYRTLLYLGIREAFLQYLMEDNIAGKYGFLRKPIDRSDIFSKLEEQSFTNSWQVSISNNIKEEILNNNYLSAWYVTSHFLNQKNLNHLIGIFKNYIQFVTDIEKRAKATGNKYYSDYKEKIELYTKLLEVLDFVKLFCAQVSNKVKDYFENEDEYAKYIADFVDYGGSDKAFLVAFCNKVSEANYFDGMNPVPNRNIVLSTMYGNSKILANSMEKIQEKDFKEQEKLKQKLAEILATNVCKEEREQKNLRRYQNEKNRLELVDVLVMTELMNDLYGRLVAYSYLRERDMLYMQLGYYYIKLFHTNSVEENDKLRKLHGACHITDGAILYQLVAFYNYGLAVYKFGKDGNVISGNKHGNKYNDFVESYCGGSAEIYKDGLCFFEDVDGRHDEYIEYRNYIDHFKYFAKADRSMLELYSSLYNGFFSYNTKLKKSISYVLPNTLLSYFIKARFEYAVAEKSNKKGKMVRKIDIRINNIESDYLTYKSGVSSKNKNDDFLVIARNKNYLQQVKKMLEFKN